MYLRGTNDYPLTEKTSGNVNRFYVYGPTGLISLIDNGTTYFVLKDHLGSTRVVLNSSSAPVTWYDYTPYGNMWRSTISEDVHYRFTGQEYDAETNLFNFRARIYDPFLGIFYAGDPAGQGFSPYMYCGGNPTMYVDKDGKFPWFIPIIVAWLSGSAANHWELNPVKWDWHNPDTWIYTIGGGLGGWAVAGEIAAGSSWTLNLTANLLSSAGDEIASVGVTLSEVGTPAFYLSGVSAGTYGLDVFYNRIKNDVSTAEDVAGVVWNSPMMRQYVPDFVSVGIGFTGMAGVGVGTSIELQWVTRGSESSWLPMLTVTQSGGAGWIADGTFNIGGANYEGPVSDLTRKKIVTNSALGDIPSFWQSYAGSGLGELGVTTYETKTRSGPYIVGGNLNVGLGLIPGPNWGTGVSNTFLLYDFR